MLVKWIFDRTMAFVGLVLVAPLLLVISVLVRIKMPDGPVIFKQDRVGIRGKMFVLYKFRTMVVHHCGEVISVISLMSCPNFGMYSLET